MEYPKYDIRKVRDLNEDELTHELRDMFLPACWGYVNKIQPVAEQLEAIARPMAVDLLDEMNDFRGMYLEEIKRALWDGVKGEYDDYYGFSVRTFETFIRKYRGSDREKKIHAAVAEEAKRWGPKPKAEKKLSEQEKDEIVRKQITDLVERIKAGKTKSELFRCYDSKLSEGVMGYVLRSIPYAYVKYAVKLGMTQEAEIMQEAFIRMKLLRKIK